MIRGKFFVHKGTVTVGELKKSMDLKKDSEAASFMSECFPHFTKLKTIFVSTTFMSKFNQDLTQDIENEKLIDLYRYDALLSFGL